MPDLALHNAMWPGLVGKEAGTDHPPITLERMLELTAAAEVDGRKFDGVDLFLYEPHMDIEADEAAVRRMADAIAAHGFRVGTLVAPVWPGTVGGPAFGSAEDRANFVLAVEKACRVAGILNDHGVRSYGAIRVDSAGSPGDWAEDPAGNTKLIGETFRAAGKVAADHGERLVAEGECCWGGMHSWKAMLDTLEETGMPETVGFQADLAHTYLYLLGVNSPEHKVLEADHSEADFWEQYEKMVGLLRPWTWDFHVAQNDGTVHGTGSHDKTGRHCPADDPNGKLDITRCSEVWLRGYTERRIEHICWDGCMFSSETLENPATYNAILKAMIEVAAAVQ